MRWVYAVASSSFVVAAAAAAQLAPPPSGARAVEVIDDGAVIRVEPSEEAARRGTVREGTRLGLRRRVLGEGCGGVFVQVADQGYICETQIRYVSAPPGGVALPQVPAQRLLPYEYMMVRSDGTRAYAHPSDYLVDAFAETLAEGFGIAVVERLVYDGHRFVRNRRGLYVMQDSLRPARPSEFSGVRIERGAALDIAWVVRDRAPVSRAPGGPAVRRARRHERLELDADAEGRQLQLAGGGYVAARHVARPEVSEPPVELSDGERWIDIDLSEQVLVAYEGQAPVYATLVSTGRPKPSHRTPEGAFRLWVKLATSDMDNIELRDVARNYSMEAVPWVQYFEGENGLHGVFWHDAFGRPRSRGCVNLAPADARWLFQFTRPTLPPGWYAILPTDRAPGTLIRVRE